MDAVLKNFKNKKILVVGDLMLDRYIWGKVRRISPEAPVPVVEVTGDTYALGGAANVANNVAALGGQAFVIGVVGGDRQAEVLGEMMLQRGIGFLPIEDERPTTVKTRVIAHNQQVVRFDQENNEKVGGKTLRRLLETIKKSIPLYDAVVVSDYRKGVVSGGLMKAVISSSGKKLVAVDPKVGHFHLYKGASVITPNLMEASEGSGIEIKDEKTLMLAGRTLLRRLNLRAVLITRGEEGMSLFQKDGAAHIPALARKVYDVTGAGDTVIAAFALSYAAGASMLDAAEIANHAAGIVVGEVGTAVATQTKLRQSLKEKAAPPAGGLK